MAEEQEKQEEQEEQKAQAGAVVILVLDQATAQKLRQDAQKIGQSFEYIVGAQWGLTPDRPQPIVLDEETVHQLNEAAAHTGRSLVEVIREHLGDLQAEGRRSMFVKQERVRDRSTFPFSIIGLGSYEGEDDVSERADEILAAEIDSEEGWRGGR
ncbi:MAG: hypothetical protein JXB47_03880 [Anaerolineae bacterium]|nr:hypothetical protein [Anaerolineae bacterium]